MKKDTGIATEIKTAGDVRNALQAELETFILNHPSAGKRAAMEAALLQLNTILDTQCEQVKDFEQKITRIELEIKASNVTELLSLAKAKAETISARNEAEIIVNELKSRKAEIEAAIKETNDSLQPAVRGHLHAVLKGIEGDVSVIFKEQVEPKITGYKAFAGDVARKHKIDLQALWVTFEPKVHNPVIEELVTKAYR